MNTNEIIDNYLELTVPAKSFTYGEPSVVRTTDLDMVELLKETLEENEIIRVTPENGLMKVEIFRPLAQ